MNKLLIVLMLFAGNVSAQSFCDTQTTGLLLPVPDFNTWGHQWGTCMRNSFIVMNDSGTVNGTTASGYWQKINVDEIGALSNTDITISSAVTIVSTLTVQGLSFFGDAISIGEGANTRGFVQGTSEGIFLNANTGLKSIISTFGTPRIIAHPGGVIEFSGPTVHSSSLTVNAPSLFTGTHTIPDDTVTTSKIKDDSVTSAKLLQQKESLLKVSGGVMVSDGTNIGIGTTSIDELLHIQSSVSLKPVLKIENTNVDSVGAEISLFKNSATAADNDLMGDITFLGKNSGAALKTFVRFRGSSSDITAGDEGGKLEIFIYAGGTAGTAGGKVLLSLGGEDVAGGAVAEVVVNPASIDVDFRVESDGSANALFVEGSSGNIGIGTASPCSTCTLHVAGSASITGNIQVGTGGPIGNIDAGEYAAIASTTTNLENTAVAIANSWRFIRIGNQVTVSGQVTLDPTASGDAFAQAEISLPIASNFTGTADASGVCTSASVTARSPRVSANGGHDTVNIEWSADDTQNKTYFCNFMYLVK